ncbi:hypothetical protein ACOMHN_003670 [Nucella lapillus]
MAPRFIVRRPRCAGRLKGIDAERFLSSTVTIIVRRPGSAGRLKGIERGTVLELHGHYHRQKTRERRTTEGDRTRNGS